MILLKKIIKNLKMVIFIELQGEFSINPLIDLLNTFLKFLKCLEL